MAIDPPGCIQHTQSHACVRNTSTTRPHPIACRVVDDRAQEASNLLRGVVGKIQTPRVVTHRSRRSRRHSFDESSKTDSRVLSRQTTRPLSCSASTIACFLSHTSMLLSPIILSRDSRSAAPKTNCVAWCVSFYTCPARQVYLAPQFVVRIQTLPGNGFAGFAFCPQALHRRRCS